MTTPTMTLALIALWLFVIAVAAVWSIVRPRPSARCAHHDWRENRPIVGYWYDPTEVHVTQFFAHRVALLAPGEMVPGKEGIDWGPIYGDPASESTTKVLEWIDRDEPSELTPDNATRQWIDKLHEITRDARDISDDEAYEAIKSIRELRRKEH